ncbi:hypothetical protein [Pontibacter populi]|uniref:TolC family protein n=1 Tax=Pontibacter populi TaxID=890055 RepID=A0ABV1RWX3_9BACT
MRLYLKMAFLSAAISLVFSACERMSQSNLQLSQQALVTNPVVK